MLQCAQPHRVLTHFLSVNGNIESFSEDQVFRDSLFQKIDTAETEEDIFVFVEKVLKKRQE